jgi:ATP-dependent helicase/nuclease subunit B
MKMTGLVSEEEQVIRAMDREFETESDVIPLKRKKDGCFTANSITASQAQMELLMEYVDHKMSEVEKKVYEGEIAVNPYCKDKKNACTYCSYKGICHFDPRIEGFRMRDLDRIGQDEAWNLIADAVGKED